MKAIEANILQTIQRSADPQGKGDEAGVLGRTQSPEGRGLREPVGRIKGDGWSGLVCYLRY